MTASFCYVVFAHRDPTAVLRIVRRLRELSPTAAVVVRYEDVALVAPDAVRAAGASPFVSTVKAGWGDWGQARMVTEALGHAAEHTDAAYFVTISAHCYPVCDLPSWEQAVAKSGTAAVLTPRPDQPLDHELTWRVLDPPRVRPAIVQRVVRHGLWRAGLVAPRLLTISPRFAPGDNRIWLGVPRRASLPEGVVLQKGATWLVVSRRAVERFTARLRAQPEIGAYFSTVRTPDEYFVPTLVTSEPDLVRMQGMVSQDRFLPGESSPEWVVVDDVARATAGPFVRKVAADPPAGVIEAADRAAERPWRGDLRPM